ncbi:RNA-splicing ligase RtcB-like protein [Frankliniella fusca]|uniref:RNA-splicing ligase RtcB-like protein n=1 Tax=Frankliniella fusca TaxID=407009 RepID=A0AAE1LYW7_9NEOP|nr:RNA-splicing ligase RtcB-like protein [Frankliniella fusca]
MCSIGRTLGAEANCSGKLWKDQELSREHVELLQIRTRCEESPLTVCDIHKTNYLRLYANNFKKCCNPFQNHSSSVKARISEVTLELFKLWRPLNLSFLPGHKLCYVCKREVETRFSAHVEAGSSQILGGQEEPGQNIEDVPVCVNQSTQTEHSVTSKSTQTNEHERLRPRAATTYRAPSSESSPFQSSGQSAQSDQSYKSAEILESLNVILDKLKVSPVEVKKLRHQRFYGIQKLEEITDAFKTVMIQAAEKENDYLNFSLTEVCENSLDFKNMIRVLKEEFLKTTDRGKKLQILSVLPQSWGREKISKEFNCPESMVRMSKSLIQSEGILALPKPKQGRPLAQETVQLIKDMYYDDEISRAMPGQRDYKSVIENGKRVHKQKRLLLCTVNELYALFCSKHPDLVSFSKFASLRPPECVSAGASGTHSVCVCTTHQNTELMAKGGGIRRKKKNEDETLIGVSELDMKDGEDQLTFEDCVDMLMCPSKSDNCYTNMCCECPNPEILRVFLSTHFEELSISSVMFQQWLTVDRCALETVVKSVDNYIEDFTEMLLEYKKHNFIAKKQAGALKEMKANLKVGEVITLGDFSENYSFLIQDAIQGYHWNNEQATLHPFVSYFRSTVDSEVQHCILVVVSDAMDHNTAAVHTFQEKLIKYLEEKIGRKVEKLYYWSDGAASQYKNRKNVSNIAHHEKDFNTPCQWHFFATSHGKSTCDSAAGAAKRSAALESKRRVDCEPIANPVQLYEYLKGSSKAMDFVYVSKLKVVSHTEKIQKRMDESAPVPGIRGIHTIIPISETAVKVKEHSLSTTERVIYITPKASSQGNVAPSKSKRKQAAKEKTSESEVQPPPKTTRTSGDSSKKAKQ